MKGGWAWWQMIILFRKALVMICAMMFDGNAVLGWCVTPAAAPCAASRPQVDDWSCFVCRFLSMLVMLGALIAQVRTNPYTTSALNAIEFCSLCFTVLIMVCGMAFRVVCTLRHLDLPRARSVSVSYSVLQQCTLREGKSRNAEQLASWRKTGFEGQSKRHVHGRGSAGVAIPYNVLGIGHHAQFDYPVHSLHIWCTEQV